MPNIMRNKLLNKLLSLEIRIKVSALLHYLLLVVYFLFGPVLLSRLFHLTNLMLATAILLGLILVWGILWPSVKFVLRSLIRL